LKKLTLDYIKSQFEKEGYTLLAKEYKNNKQKLKYLCPNEHKHSITWANWQQGQRCKSCAIESRRNKLKLDFNIIKESFEKEGYTLLTKKYKNQYQKLKFICPNGHRHSIIWNNWQQGSRCLYCSGKAKKTIEEIREAFEFEGYTLLAKEYKNNKQKLDYICSNGHKHSISWHEWQRNYRCPYCAHIKIANKRRLDYEFVKQSFEKEGYTLLTQEYKNNNQKLDYICPNGHKHSIQWNAWQLLS